MSQSSSAPASSLSTRLRVHSPRRPHALTSHVRVASESASTSNATSRSGGVLEHLARQGIRRTQDVKPEDAWGLYGFRKCSAPVGRQKDSLGAEDQDHRDTGSGDGPKIPPVSELRTFSPADKGALSSASAPVPDGFGGYQLTPELFPSSPSPSPALTFTHYAVAPAPPAAIRPLATTPPAARILPGPAPSSAAPAFQGGPALSPLALPRMRPLSTPDARRTPLRLPAPLAASSPHLLAGPPAQPAATDYAQPQHARQMRTVSAATARLDQYDPRSGMSPSLIQAQQDRLRHWRWSAPVQAPPSLPQPGMPMQQYARYPTTAIAPNSHRRSLPPSPLTRSFMAADGSEVSAAPFRGAISSSPPSLSLSSLPSAPHPQAFVRQYPAASANIVLKPGMLAPACISRSCSGSDDASGGACGAEPRLIQSVQRQEQKQGQGQRAQSSPMLKIAAAFKYAAAFSHNQLESREVKRNGDVASKSQQQQHGRRLQRRARGSSLSDDPAQGHVQDAPSSPRTEATSRTQSLLYKMRNGRKGPASDSVAAASAPPVPHGHAMPSEPWSAARGPRGGVAQSAGSQRRQFAGEQRQTSSLRRSDRSAFLHPQQPASNSVAAVEMSRPKSGSRSTQHSSSSKASLSAYQPISGSQGRKRALRSGASSSSITSASSRHTQHSRASASSYSSSSVSASSRSTGHSYRRIALTAAQELSRALGSASQSSDSRYAICAEFRRDSSGSASAPPSVCVSRKSSDASKNTKSSKTSMSKYAPMKSYADAVRSAALQVPPRPQPAAAFLASPARGAAAAAPSGEARALLRADALQRNVDRLKEQQQQQQRPPCSAMAAAQLPIQNADRTSWAAPAPKAAVAETWPQYRTCSLPTAVAATPARYRMHEAAVSLSTSASAPTGPLGIRSSPPHAGLNTAPARPAPSKAATLQSRGTPCKATSSARSAPQTQAQAGAHPLRIARDTSGQRSPLRKTAIKTTCTAAQQPSKTATAPLKAHTNRTLATASAKPARAPRQASHTGSDEEDDRSLRTDDEASELWKSLEKRLGIDLGAKLPTKLPAKPTLAERRGRQAVKPVLASADTGVSQQHARKLPVTPSRIPLAKHRLEKLRAARSVGELQPKVPQEALPPSRSPTASVAKNARRGPGERDPLPPCSPRRGAISVIPGFQRLLPSSSMPQSPVMKDPSLSIITERSCESPQKRNSTISSTEEMTESIDANANAARTDATTEEGILASTLVASLLRQSSESGSEYSQSSASKSEARTEPDMDLPTPPAHREIPAPHALDAADLRMRLASLLPGPNMKKEAIDTAAAEITNASLLLRSDSMGTLDSEDENSPSCDGFWRGKDSYVGFASGSHRAALCL